MAVGRAIIGCYLYFQLEAHSKPWEEASLGVSNLCARCNFLWFITVIKCKKLISLQHRVRAMKSHIQNSTNHFFWYNVIARSHIALTIHLTLPHLTFALPHYHASKKTEIMLTLQRL